MTEIKKFLFSFTYSYMVQSDNLVIILILSCTSIKCLLVLPHIIIVLSWLKQKRNIHNKIVWHESVLMTAFLYSNFFVLGM